MDKTGVDGTPDDVLQTPIVAPSGTIRAWSLDRSRLESLAADHAAAYQAAAPFPHVVLDGIFPDELLDELEATFPPSESAGWTRHRGAAQRKLQWTDPAALPAAHAHLIALLQAGPFLDFLHTLTDIPELVGDPLLHHGGLHLIEPGGHLNVHVDEIRHPRLGLYRRVNVIVYLNRGWNDDWGGQLELWDPALTRCEKRIAPRFNRTVIFDVGVDSHHGHPVPMAAPAGVARRSIATYYYTAENAKSLWSRRVTRSTGSRGGQHGRRQWQRVAADLAPPILFRELRRMKRRRAARRPR